MSLILYRYKWTLTYPIVCVHAKLLQTSPTLCVPMGQSPPGFSVHGILQARICGWGVSMPCVSLILLTVPVVSLFTLFAESRVRKACAKKLEGDSRSRRNCRHIYCLLADTAAMTVDTLHYLLSWLTQHTEPWHSSNAAASWGGAHTGLVRKIAHNQGSTLWCACAVL